MYLSMKQRQSWHREETGGGRRKGFWGGMEWEIADVNYDIQNG